MDKYQEQVRVYKAFGDENRLKILELLQGGEKCACKLLEELNIQQSTLSHHMKILCDAHVVQARKDGKWMYYTIDSAGSCFAIDNLRLLLKNKKRGRKAAKKDT